MKIALLCLLLIPIYSLTGASIFTVEGRNILLNGEPFFIRGICYNAAPIGTTGTEPPYGDYYTDDYLPLTERDAVNLRKLGANAQRGYGWIAGQDHQKYLDRAYNNGEQPVYVFINVWIDPKSDWSNPETIDELVQYWVSIAEETKDHPGVIGYLLGNEHNNYEGNGDKPLFWKAKETIAAAVKNTAPDKLVSVPITDRIDQVTQFDAAVPSIDFWAIQVYRSTTFGTFFEEYEKASNKPVVLTEFGYDAFDNNVGQEYPDNAQFTAEVVEGMIYEIKSNRALCAGGCIFEYRDEWWKSKGSIHEQDQGGFKADGMPDKVLNEEWWGIFAAERNGKLPDKLIPRQLYFSLEKLWGSQ